MCVCGYMYMHSHVHIHSQFKLLKNCKTEVTPDNHSGIFTKVPLVRSIQHHPETVCIPRWLRMQPNERVDGPIVSPVVRLDTLLDFPRISSGQGKMTGGKNHKKEQSGRKETQNGAV